MSDALPPLRNDLDMIPMELDGRRVVAVRDPLGLVSPDQAFSLDLLRLWAALPLGAGEEDLRSALALATGADVPLDEARRVAAVLDGHHVLDSPGHRRARQEAARAYAALEARPPALAGSAYPADAAELGPWLDQVLGLDRGPVAGPGPALPGPGGRLLAVVAPHIDPRAGAPAYAAAYKALGGLAPLRAAGDVAPLRVVVLGVAHAPMDGLFCLTAKPFDTPLGRVAVDAGAVERLARAAKGARAPDELAHRAEHSVEFQALFLQRVLGPGSFCLAPVLCGSAHGLADYSRAAFLEAAGGFCAELGALLAEPGTICVAGVDFCHIGPKFGHDRPACDLEGEAAAHDNALLGRLAALDPEGFWAESARVGDRYNVCGFSALACLLEALAGQERRVRARVLDYRLWREEPTRSAVGFAAASFTLRPKAG